jgi:hypothetical protein
MNAQAFRAACFLVAASVFAPTSRAVFYEATLLHPTGFDSTKGTGASGGSQVGWGRGAATSDAFHALLWTGTPQDFVDLHPTGFQESYAVNASNTSQVGWGDQGPDEHALLWHGTAASAVDLNPAGFDNSKANSVSGANQVGYASNDGLAHAMLWSGSAVGVVDLNPSGFDFSIANGISGTKQVGFGSGSTTGGNAHALLWSGNAASRVDLHPTGFDYSYAVSVSNSTQAGYGIGSATGGNNHALIWHGTKSSVVDLNPTGALWSQIAGVSMAGEAGTAHYGPTVGGQSHATVWFNTAASAVDLHPYLSGLGGLNFLHSFANAIADDGSIVGIAETDFNEYAVLWRPVVDSGVPGDYNNNGTVDAGDYIAWRKGLTTLHNEVATIGSNTPQDYTEWRARFGNITGSGASLDGASVPEPVTSGLMSLALYFVLSLPGSRRRRLF